MPKFLLIDNSVSDVYSLKMDSPYIRVTGIERDEVLHVLASDDSPDVGDIAISFYHESKPRSNTAILPFGRGTKIRFKLDNTSATTRVEAWITEPTITRGTDLQIETLEVLEEIRDNTYEMLILFKEWDE